MNRDEAAAFQAVGIRVESFDEACGHCGRPSSYVRAEDRYHHKCDTPNLSCWLAISQGREPKHVVSHRDSRSDCRRDGRRTHRSNSAPARKNLIYQ